MDKSGELKFLSLEIRESGGHAATRTLDTEALASIGADAPFAGPVQVSLEFSVGEKELLLQGTATGTVRDQCARCLVPVTPGFAATLDQVYGNEISEIDVSGEIREAVMLALPERALCRPDCKGLCPKCGQNLNEKDCGHKPETPNAFAKLKGLIQPKQEKKS